MYDVYHDIVHIVCCVWYICVQCMLHVYMCRLVVDDDTGPETPTLDKGVRTQPTYPAPYDRGSETTYSSHVYILYMLYNMHILSVVYIHVCVHLIIHMHIYTYTLSYMHI